MTDPTPFAAPDETPSVEANASAAGATPREPQTADHGREAGARKGRLDRLRDRWRRTRTVLQAPRVEIEVHGDEDVLRIYRAFTARHRRFKVTSAKRWGVALLRLPPTANEYFKTVSRQARRNRVKAVEAGYRYVEVAPLDHVDEILEINQSAPSRQGRPMDSLYVERAEVEAAFGRRPKIHGIVDASGRLRAYADLYDIGGAYTFAYLIGHADDLPHGIMYLLMGEIVRACIEARRSDGSPTWLMADTFWGASPGLAYFKDRTGFRPFTVTWVWSDKAG